MPTFSFVRDVMQGDVVTVQPDHSLRDLLSVLARHRISGAPVVNGGGTVLGVISLRDVAEFLSHQLEVQIDSVEPAESEEDEDGAYFGRLDGIAVIPETDGLDDHLVRDLMTPAVFSVAPNDGISDAAAFMLRGRIHRALVTEGERLVGIVTPLDLLHALVPDGAVELATVA